MGGGRVGVQLLKRKFVNYSGPSIARTPMRPIILSSMARCVCVYVCTYMYICSRTEKCVLTVMYADS